MVYSSKQQPTTPLLVVGHEISFANGDSSRRGGNGNVVASGAVATTGRNQMAMSSNGGGAGGGGGGAHSGGGGGSATGGGGAAALGYWNRSPVALNKSSNRYIDQSKAFIEDAYMKPSRGDVARSPYYPAQQQPKQQAVNHRPLGGYYVGNNSQPNSRTNSLTRPATNRPAAPINDDELTEVSVEPGKDCLGTVTPESK